MNTHDSSIDAIGEEPPDEWVELPTGHGLSKADANPPEGFYLEEIEAQLASATECMERQAYREARDCLTRAGDVRKLGVNMASGDTSTLAALPPLDMEIELLEVLDQLRISSQNHGALRNPRTIDRYETLCADMLQRLGGQIPPSPRLTLLRQTLETWVALNQQERQQSYFIEGSRFQMGKLDIPIDDTPW